VEYVGVKCLLSVIRRVFLGKMIEVEGTGIYKK
jgi:hypothetical protein